MNRVSEAGFVAERVLAFKRSGWRQVFRAHDLVSKWRHWTIAPAIGERRQDGLLSQPHQALALERGGQHAGYASVMWW